MSEAQFPTVGAGAATVAVAVSDFGPLRRAEVELRPLTIIVGPNNSGKSYLSMLIYSLTRGLDSAPRIFTGRWRLGFGSDAGYEFLLNRGIDDEEQVERMADRLEATFAGQYELGLLVDEEDDLPSGPQLLNEYCGWLVRQYLERAHTEIERCFGTELKDLRNHTARKPTWIRVTHGPLSWTGGIRCTAKAPTYVVDSLPEPSEVISAVQGTPPRQHMRMSGVRSVQLVVERLNAVAHAMFAGFPDARYYLPAARSGFLQSHKATASAVVSRSSMVGIEEFAVPKLSGVVADFIATLIQMPASSEYSTRGASRNQDIRAVATFLESGLLGGRVSVSQSAAGYPDFAFDDDQQKYDLYQTSSMISEVAPIVLFLRHVVERTDLLIIEEPESHLHPESQRILARSLVRLANAGCPVLLTTHSDYFLSQINNSIGASRLTEAERTRAGVDLEPDETIFPQEVGAFLVRETRSPKGSVVDSLDVNEDGVTEEQFSQVAQELYDETFAIDFAVDQ